MTDQSKKYLSDILYAIELIENFTADVVSYADYVDDVKTQSAVERQLGIIGEALNQFQKLHPDMEMENVANIIGLRNRIIHSYDTIDTTIIWAIIKNHLGPLKNRVQTLSSL